MMQQFYDLKAKHPEALLLFRCGDFYETYSDDAVIASEILGITLTRRNNGAGGASQMEMAGFRTMPWTHIYPSWYVQDGVLPSVTSWRTRN